MTHTALLVGGAGATGVPIALGLRESGFDVTILHRGAHEPAEIADFKHIHADPHFAEPMIDALGESSFDLVVATYGRMSILAEVFAGRCQRFLTVGGIPIYAGYLDPRSTRPVGMKLFSPEGAPLAEPDRMAPAGAASFAAKMRLAEDAVMQGHHRGAYAATIFRYPVIYGPHAISESDWSIVKRVLDGRSFILAPDEGMGIITRCAAINCAHAVLLSIDRDMAKGRVFNLADDDQYTLRQWMELALETLDADVEVIGLPKSLNWAASHLLPLAGTVSDHAIIDAGAARQTLGYTDVLTARQALAETLTWRMNNPPPRSTGDGWGDPFDYALEDEVRRRLKTFEAECADIAQLSPPVHPYPHPKRPGLEPDHRGR